MTNKVPNIVVWGIGPHALKNILPALFMVEELSLYGICTRKQATIIECTKNLQCKAWTDPAQMLADPKVDIVYLTTPIGLHAVQGQQVLEAGKHLWCEKSFTANLLDTQQLLVLAEQKKLSIAEGFMYLDHPHFARILRFVQGQEMGCTKSIICRFGIPKLEQPGFRNDPKIGGGVFWDVGSYTISIILAMLPTNKWQIKYAERFFSSYDKIDYEGRVLLYSNDGVTAFLQWYSGACYKNDIDIVAEHGSLFTDKVFSKAPDYAPKIILSDQYGVKSEEMINPCNYFVAMFRRFVKLLKSKDAVYQEQQNILRRATLLNEIEMSAHVY